MKAFHHCTVMIIDALVEGKWTSYPLIQEASKFRLRVPEIKAPRWMSAPGGRQSHSHQCVHFDPPQPSAGLLANPCIN